MKGTNKEDSDESNLTDDQIAEHGAETGGESSSRRALEDNCGLTENKAPTLTAAVAARPAPVGRSRFFSCSTITFAVIILYFILAFYELYTVFTPEVSPARAA